ncbi:hypothetical protein O6H91_02G115200 [Diphasiastrum complanatum]|uniref:Uncharacterized protein n=1 Tax=Diphasiastrum complanatum TaxID=34168 RepID=A0ACC2EK13_DIPCM|nr:hypothetical protein O6H91_Y566700 [Diphasiastrum complanatum]KAJ7566708.1 hypothetical protein O6H91_02G115200 [Diphasiastrum complanatum]
MQTGWFSTMLYASREDGEKSISESALSPRRALSLSRDRASVSIFGRDLQDNNQQHDESQPRRQGAKPAEVYGFVGAICTIVATAIFFVWAYLPEAWLHSIGITYYPSRYWAVAIPAYMMVVPLFVCSVYISLNHITTPPPHSFNTIFDEHTREHFGDRVIPDEVEEPIHPISDIPIIEVNTLLFGKASQKRYLGLSGCEMVPTRS